MTEHYPMTVEQLEQLREFTVIRATFPSERSGENDWVLVKEADRWVPTGWETFDFSSADLAAQATHVEMLNEALS